MRDGHAVNDRRAQGAHGTTGICREFTFIDRVSAGAFFREGFICDVTGQALTHSLTIAVSIVHSTSLEEGRLVFQKPDLSSQCSLAVADYAAGTATPHRGCTCKPRSGISDDGCAVYAADPSCTTVDRLVGQRIDPLPRGPWELCPGRRVKSCVCCGGSCCGRVVVGGGEEAGSRDV